MCDQEQQATLSAKTIACDSRKHVVTYSRVRPHECLVCHKGFMHADSLKNHICIQTKGKPPREIPRIDFKKEGKELKGFMPKRREGTVGRVSCEICQVDFRSLSYLTEHLRTHTKEKPFVCELCHKSFACKKYLKDHLRIHTGEKPFICVICSKAFGWRSSLNCHLQVAHTVEQPVSCTYCHRRFPTVAQLKSHNKYHAKEHNYSCPVCKKKFHWKSSCVNHMKIHPGNRTPPVVKSNLQRLHARSKLRIQPGEKS